MKRIKRPAALLCAGLALCLLAGCSQSPAPAAPGSGSTAPAATPAAPDGPAQGAPTGRLYLLANSPSGLTLVSDGTNILAKGNCGLITDIDTREVCGYWVDTPCGTGHSYDVFDRSGSPLAQGLAATPQYFLKGRLLSFRYDGFEETAGVRLTDLQTGRELMPANTLCSASRVAQNRYLISGFYGESGEAPFLMDGDGNVLHRFEGYREAYVQANPDGSKGYVQLMGNDHAPTALYDPDTAATLPYVSAYFINDGYCNLAKYWLDDQTGTINDLVDANGNVVEADIPLEYYVYTPGIKTWYDAAVMRHGVEKPGEVIVTSDNYITSGMVGTSVYTVERADNVFTLYDAQGEVLYQLYASPENYLTIDEMGDTLAVSYRNTVMLLDENGLLWQKELPPCGLNGWTSLQMLDKEAGRMTLCVSDEVAGSYHIAYTLLDMQGNELAGPFNELYNFYGADLYRARMGFTYGLVDADGNWVLSRSIFADEPEDEILEEWEM